MIGHRNLQKPVFILIIGYPVLAERGKIKNLFGKELYKLEKDFAEG